MKRKSVFLTVLAVFLVLSVAVGPAQAYFTTNVTAKGGYVLKPGDTEITEPKVSEWVKHVVISNRNGAGPVFVRAQAFCGEQYELDYSGTGWSDGGDGYWYYGTALDGGENSEELLVHIGNIPTGAKEGTDFHVTVIYEYVTALYDGDGKADPDLSWTYGEAGVMGGNS